MYKQCAVCNKTLTETFKDWFTWAHSSKKCNWCGGEDTVVGTWLMLLTRQWRNGISLLSLLSPFQSIY